MSSLTVSEVSGQLVVDSRLIADELGVEHVSLRKTVEKYLTELQGFGVVGFEVEKPLEGSQGGRPERYCYLNEDQATFLMTLSRNTPKVVACKQHLVKAFAQAKQIIKDGITESQQPVQRVLPVHTAVEYAEAAYKTECLPDGHLKRLLKNALVDELDLQQNLKYLPVAEKPEKFTIVKVRAKALGYSSAQIGDGNRLGKFVRGRVEPAFQEMIGRYPVYHYEITPALDEAIHLYFS